MRTTVIKQKMNTVSMTWFSNSLQKHWNCRRHAIYFRIKQCLI